MTERYLDLTELAFVAGPLVLPDGFSSVALHETEDYPPESIAGAILAVPGVALVHAATPSWDQWRACWNSGQRYIELDLLTCEMDPAVCSYSLLWGGSSVKTHCLLADLLAFWESVRSLCPAVWLHDTETVMWSPETFACEVIKFQTMTECQSWRPGWGKL